MGKRALLIQTALLGDSAFSGKLISSLQEFSFDVVCRSASATFYSQFSNVGNIFELNKRSLFSIFNVLSALRKNPFEVIINFTSSVTGRFLGALTAGKKKFFTERQSPKTVSLNE